MLKVQNSPYLAKDYWFDLNISSDDVHHIS